MVDIVVSVASKVAEYLVSPVGRQCGYVISTDSYVGQLKEELEKLDDAMVEVQRSVDFAQNNNKEIKPEVNRWRNNAETVANKAHGVLNNDGRAKKTCFCGWLLNPKKSYCLGRDARKTVQAIQALILQKRQFKKVHYENAQPPGYVPRPTNEITSASDWGRDSRASIFQGIMKALDDEKINMIGVYGPGGVGKTKLLADVEKKLRNEKRLFDVVAIAEVRRTSDLKKIQDDIAYALGVDLKNEPSEAGRRDLLFNRLQKNPSEKVLVILDDLWEKLDLRAVGIPSGDESRGCKLLLTSRYKNVLQQMKCAPSIFHLKGLEDNEALKLFEKEVGDRLKEEDELKEIAPQVVKKLAGLPLLIISVACTLKDSDLAAWRSSLITIDAEEKETIVQFSYDHLKREDTRSLFLLCGLIGGTIEVETLLVLGMGLGLFEECKEMIQNFRDRLDTMLSELRSACLLLDGGDDKDKVTIHDLYSEVVVSTPFRNKNSLMINSNYGTWPKEKLEECWAGLFNVRNDRLAEIMPCRFPHAKILMLSEQYFMGDCSRMDFTHMKELRALCLCSMSITSLPSSMEILGNLQSLSINCYVEDVAILGKLKALHILSFAGSTISRLPKEIGELTNLRSLNLSDCCMLQIIEPGALKRLINLEELHMKDSFDRWMGKDQIPSESRNARIAELKCLTKITSLEISVAHPTILLEEGDLPFGKLVRFWINIGKCYGGKFGGLRTMKLNLEGLRTMKLKLEGCDSILLKEWVQTILQKTQYLHLEGLRESRNNAHELCTQGFGQLKHLNILNSPSIKYIANSSYGQPVTAFKILESLVLKNLINLEKICNCPIATECFSQLKVVRIEKCHRLKNLWFLSEMQSLVHLEEIRICECDSLQAIITDDAGNVEVAVDYFELPNVRRLDLRELPNMTSFCTGAEGAPIQVSLPRLESLVMVGLLGPEEILFSEPSFKYSNLKSLEIQESKSTLKKILKLDWILKLPNLESLKIKGSPSAEVVFNMEEQLDIDDSPSSQYIANSSDGLPLTAFMKLEFLFLENLINLEKICHGPIAPECFSKLKTVSVRQCNRLKYLWRLSDMQRFVQLEEIEVQGCDSMQSIVTHDAKEDIVSADYKVELPNVRRLELDQLPNMTSFCTGAEITSEITPIQVSFPRLEFLVMVGLLDLEKILYGQPPSEYSNLKSIKIRKSRSKSSLFKSNWILRLPNLETLDIRSSPSAEAIFDLGELKVTRDVEILSRLMELTIMVSPNLRCMWKQDVKLQEISIFRSLKKLEVWKMGLAFLFPMSVAKCLREIRDIQLFDCPNMKAVIVDEGRDEGIDDTIEFPLLERLYVKFCPIEKFFSYPHGKKELVTATSDSQDAYSDSFFDQKVSLPSLKTLSFDKVGSFKRIWHGDLPKSSFCELATLTLTNCSELLNVFPSTIIGRLHSLKEVNVLDLESLESLFDCGSFGPNTERKIVSLPKLEKVEVSRARRLLNVFPSTIIGGLHNLKEVKVLDLESLESLFDCGSFGPNTERKIVSLPKLEKVKVSGARRLGHMVKSDSYTVLGFPSLTKVEVTNCPELRYLFPNYTATTLGKLEDLKIHNCKHMKEVVHKEEGGQSKPEVMNFPALDYLSILWCHNFGAFIRSPTSVERPSGETAEVDDESPQAFFNEMARFPNIRNLHIAGAQCKELWNNQIPIDSFCKLKSLKLGHCDNLLRIAPSRMWKRLQHYLETLEVDSCHLIEIIFESDVCAEKNGNLRRLLLWNLAKLRHIWQYDGLRKGGEIRYIQVTDCPNMKAVIVDEEGRDEGIDDMIEFPLLESLCISGCPTDKFFSYPCGKKESITSTSDSQDAYSDSFFHPKVSLPSLKTLSFRKVGSFKRIWHGELPRSSFCKLATLSLSYCADPLNVFLSTIIGRLHNLQSVQIENCPSLESLFDCGSLDANTEQTSVLLPKLEEVTVTEAGKLRSLVKSDSQMSWGFPSLKIVKVRNCSNMRYLFPHFTATTLEKLERIDVSQCEQMKEVVSEEEGGRSKVDVRSFSSLRHLRILQCPNFEAFIQSPTSVKRQLDETTEENDESPQPLFNEMVTFPNIRSLEIGDLRCKELWNNQIPTDSFWKLESLELKNCDNLQRIVPSYMWKRLQHCLEILRVISCRSIEIIYEGDGTDTGNGKLMMLVLHNLENLRHIWQPDGLPNIPFPNLRYVEAKRCSRLKMLFATFTAKFLRQIEELVVESCGDMELIAGDEKREEATGTTITFSELTALRLFELPKFRGFLPEKHSLKFPDSEDFPSLRHLSIRSCGAEQNRGPFRWGRLERWFRERQERIRRLAI